MVDFLTSATVVAILGPCWETLTTLPGNAVTQTLWPFPALEKHTQIDKKHITYMA